MEQEQQTVLDKSREFKPDWLVFTGVICMGLLCIVAVMGGPDAFLDALHVLGYNLGLVPNYGVAGGGC